MYRAGVDKAFSWTLISAFIPVLKSLGLRTEGLMKAYGKR